MYQEMLDRLLEGRARATGELQRFYKEAEARADEHGRLTGEDQAEWEKRSTDLDDFDNRIAEITNKIQGERQADEYRAEAEKFVRPNTAPVGDDDWATQEKRVYDFFTAAPNDPHAPQSVEISFRGLDLNHFENGRRVVRESRTLKPVGDVESRDLNVGTPGDGGFTFGPSFRSVLYQYLVFHSAMRQTQATILTTGGGENLLVPTATAPAAGTIVNEAAAIGEADPTFGQATLSAYKYANIVLVSSELESDTQVDLLGYIARIMGQRLGDGMGAHYVTGTGSGQPQGVLVGAGTVAQVVGGTPGTSGATFAELTQVFDKIIPPYQINAEWFLGQAAMQKIRALTNSQGTPIFLPSLQADSPMMMFGKGIILDPTMPTPASNATSIAFGDFSTYFIRDAGGLRFERSTERYFDTDQIGYRAIWRSDGRLIDTSGAIATYKGGTA